MKTRHNPAETNPDIILVGAGIMSATLGVLLKKLQPDLSIEIFERLDTVAAESTDAWNNAGTGHSAFCELNYTPERPDGSIDISKAVKIADSFEVSRQFWAHLVQQGFLSEPHAFINSIPHMSFVLGAENVNFLRKRHDAMIKSPLFRGMEYSEDPEQLTAWMPLVMKGRDKSEKVAATRMALGTDVNFGALTRQLFDQLKEKDGVTLHLHHEVRKLRQEPDGRWRIKVKDLSTGRKRKAYAKFVFIGAGGGALPLLLKTGIPEAEGFGGFPVSGQWLICQNPAVVAQHQAKVYGLASVGSPPMSVPHLDSRVIGGEKALLFGPYAGFSTKFLKKGSLLDLPRSIKFSNIVPMIEAGLDNLKLTKYLIDQVRQSADDRMEALRVFVPKAVKADWKLEVAGQRVQIIKEDPKEGGVLEFGTEVVSSADGTMSALLGASPGASTSVSIMLGLLQRCFKERVNTPEWQQKLKEMIPSYGQSLAGNPMLCDEIRAYTSETLGLKHFNFADKA
ncbi:malate:quinone oxidoreductase [Pontibacter sp. 172403-2]|uniref:malate:quinone oxidoreductase n=1 Tax=Pontibacter rufus TaxID=2791028 RepID=UPI0018AFE4DE|nr:malate:quinone oxidoreductase [Pontibacter sp. 172403-2]